MNTINTNIIHHGDANSFLKTLPANSIDLVITDPPYLCGYKDRDGRSVANDTSAQASNVLPVFHELYRVLKPNSYCISFYGWNAIADFATTWQAAGFRTIGHIVWAKDYASKTGFMHYRHESAFVLAKGRPQQPHKLINDVQPWHYTGNKAHPTEKAVDIITPLVRSFSNKGDIILDPFLGSGTTAVAAALTNRRYICVELEQRYCTHARRRLEGVERYLRTAA